MMHCRYCHSELNSNNIFLDLGNAPPSNAYLSFENLDAPEITYPLKLFVCDNCWLAQTQDYAKCDDLFSHDYSYFSSTSKSWLEHAHDFSIKIINNLSLSKNSFVIEIASNDGYLLKNFLERKIPCLGIEPTDSTANVAEQSGIPVLREFFGKDLALKLANQGKFADLICGNNVYAHVPDIGNFTEGLKIILKKKGVITLEFPHLLKLLTNGQFDTVYHEHYSYLSLTSVKKIFSESGLNIFNVEELSTHGGSLRIYGCHDNEPKYVDPSVDRILSEELSYGIHDLKVYMALQDRANKIKNELLLFLINQKKLGKTIAGYGAAAKGNTLLNYSGIKKDLIDFVCDAAIAKQNKFMPGSHIPIMSPDFLMSHQPDWIIIFPWNISSEILIQLQKKLEHSKFVILIPEFKILN